MRLLVGMLAAVTLVRALITGGGEAVDPFDVSVSVASTAIVSSGGTLDWHGRSAIVRRPSDGALVHVYRRGTSHGTNVGALYIRFSDDHGATWTAENTTLDGNPVSGFPMKPQQGLPEGQEAGEPWLYVAPDGTLLVHMWNADYSETAAGTWQSKSTDGEIWTTPKLVGVEGLSEADNLKSFATHDDFVYDRTIYALTEVVNWPAADAAMYLIRSDDNGTSWEVVSELIDNDEGTAGAGGFEAGLEYVGNETLVTVIRDTTNTYTYQRVSTDMGATWGALQDITSQVGASGRQRLFTRSHLQEEPGWWKDPVLIMCGYTHETPGSQTPRRNAVWVSPDRGSSWDGPFEVDSAVDDAGYGDMFYNPTTGEYVFVSYQGDTLAAAVKQYNLEITFS